MFKLKRKKNGFSIELTGTLDIDETKILSYDLYREREEQRQVKEQILDYLKTTFHLGNSEFQLYSQYNHGYSAALDDIANKLATDGEI